MGRRHDPKPASTPDLALARRTVLKGAGLRSGAGLVGGLAAIAQAQTTGAGPEPAGDGPIWSANTGPRRATSLSTCGASAPRARARRAAAAGAVPGARLLELGALLLRSHRAGQGRILAHERVRALRLRRVDDGPRRLRLFRQLRQQFRHRQRRRGPQGRHPGGGAGDRAGQDAFLRHLVGRHPRRRLRAGRARAGGPAGAGRLHLQGEARPRSAGGRSRSSSTATTTDASATRP